MFKITKLNKTQKIILTLLSFLIGITLASICVNIGYIIPTNYFEYFIFFQALILVSIILVKNKTSKVILITCLFFCLGITRFYLEDLKDNQQHNIKNYHNQTVLLQGIINQDPQTKIAGNTIILKTQKIVLDSGIVKTTGKIILHTSLYPKYKYGDVLEVKCNIKEPSEDEEFSYKKYLYRFNIYTICQFPKIKKIDTQGNIVLKTLYSLKNKIKYNINKILLEPHSSLLIALVLGDKNSIPANVVGKVRDVGLSHVIVISGMHVAIISQIIISILLSFYINKKQQIVFTVLLLTIFLLIIGMPPSALRAVIMGNVVLLSKYIGRKVNTGKILLLVASVMLIFQPKLLVYDVGFQLSFLATLGIVYFSPILKKRFCEKDFLGLKEIFFTSLSAMITTMPIILYSFGKFSLLAIISNVLVLPFVAIVLFIGLLGIFISFLSIFLAKIIMLPVMLFFTYFMFVVEHLSKLQFAILSIKIDILAVIVMYVVIFYVYRLIVIPVKPSPCHSRENGNLV